MTEIELKPVSFTYAHLFGPPVGKVQLPQQVIDDLNAAVVDDMPDHGENLLNHIELQPTMPDATLDLHREFFIKIARTFLVRSGDREGYNRDIAISQAWYVRMRHAHEFNPAHVHPHCSLSAIGFLQLPENYDECVREDESCGRLEFFGALPQYLSTAHARTNPKVGEFYIFPWHLTHGVMPLGEKAIGERRSFSMNFLVRDETGGHEA